MVMAMVMVMAVTIIVAICVASSTSIDRRGGEIGHAQWKHAQVEKHMFWELMGICFSCRRPTSGRLNSKISEHISASVTPLHVCLEEQRGPELGLCDASQAHKPQVRELALYAFISRMHGLLYSLANRNRAQYTTRRNVLFRYFGHISVTG